MAKTAIYQCTERENINHLQIHAATMAEKITNVENKISSVETKIDNLPAELTKIFVSKVEFESHKSNLLLIQRIVYGAVGLVLTIVCGAMLYLVVVK